MVESTGPIDPISIFALSQKSSSDYDRDKGTSRARGVAQTVVIQSFHDGTVRIEIGLVEPISEFGFVFGSHSLDEFYVLLGVEGAKFLLVGEVLAEVNMLRALSRSKCTTVSK